MQCERCQRLKVPRRAAYPSTDFSRWKIRKAAFVLSTGRTATQTIARVFNTFEGVTAFHQPRPYRRFRIDSCKAICGRIAHAELKRRFLARRQRLLNAITTPIYLESNNYLFGFAGVLGELFESASLFHVVRHPFSFVRSQLNFGGYSGLKRLMLDYYPCWTIKPEQYGQPGLRWRSMSRFEKYAWVWTVTNSSLDAVAQTTADYHRIHFEDLFDKSCTGLQRIAEAIGLQWDPQQHRSFRDRRFNSSRFRLVPAWEEWDRNLRKQLAGICGEQAKKYGYSLQP